MTDTIREASPSQTALSESMLHKKGLCDYVVNVADGCTHGCRYRCIYGCSGCTISHRGRND